MANKVAPVAAAYLVEDDDKSSDIKKKPAHADGLKRQQSIKIAADHAKEHKYKYLTACVAIIVALVVGLVLGLAVLFFLQSKGVLNASLSAQLTAIKGLPSRQPQCSLPKARAAGEDFSSQTFSMRRAC